WHALLDTMQEGFHRVTLFEQIRGLAAEADAVGANRGEDLVHVGGDHKPTPFDQRPCLGGGFERQCTPGADAGTELRLCPGGGYQLEDVTMHGVLDKNGWNRPLPLQDVCGGEQWL